MPILRAEHFLRRAGERLSGALARRALWLYLDRALVQYILARIPRDPRSRCFAIALAPGDDAPCAIVTVDGWPVTCLGGRIKHSRSPLLSSFLVPRLPRAYLPPTLAPTRRA